MEFTNNPLVSILMTAFNMEKFIAEAIESVLASSYKNFELIIVDDSSFDQTVSIARKYEATDTRVKVYINTENLGDYPNRNKAAGYAKGKYLKYLDADDMIYPYSLAIMIAAMEENPSAALAIQQETIDDTTPYPILVQPQWVARTHFLKKGVISAGPSATILRTAIFEQLGGFSGKQYIGDNELWMKIAFSYPIVLLQPSLVWWRTHDEQQMVKEKRDNMVLLIRHQLSKSFILADTVPLQPAERSLAIKKLNRRLLTNSLVVLNNRFNIAGFIRIIMKSGMSFGEFLRALIH